MEELLKNFRNCLQKEAPFCGSACPFDFDILSFMEKVKRGSLDGAYKIYRNAVGFPAIVSALCQEPCSPVCPGSEVDAPIQLRRLEEGVVAGAVKKEATDYNLPGKKKRIAIIGGGFSGLGCALRLCTKKYQVEIFEAGEKLGGRVNELLPEELIAAELDQQFLHEECIRHFNRRINRAEELDGMGFDAVYVATGMGGEDFGLRTPPEPGRDAFCGWNNGAGWFAGGGLLGKDPVEALASGLWAGTVIDNFLKTGNLLYPSGKKASRICLDPAKKEFEPAVKPGNGIFYDREEMVEEAARCILCQCDFCRTHCDLLDYTNKWPLRIRDEVQATILPGTAEVKATPAKRLMSTCNLCGLCKEVCPEDIALGGLILEGRRSMHQQKKVPWVFHDYWLRDMDFTNSDEAAIWGYPREGKEYKDKKRVFFPGCQLGASEPGLVEEGYRLVRAIDGGAGIFSYCCGAPAQWSGDVEKHRKVLDEIRRIWETLDRPELIMACPTCIRQFQESMPEIPVTSLYQFIAPQVEILSLGPLPSDAFNASGNEGSGYSLFDPCASRGDGKMQDSVREILRELGVSAKAGKDQEEWSKCCGFGGQPGIADPEYARFAAQKRLRQLEGTILCYCINCRDSFREEGREALHILELTRGKEILPSLLAGPTEGRENRKALRRRLALQLDNQAEKIEEKAKEKTEDKAAGLKLIFSEDLKERMRKERILEEDVEAVIRFCEKSGRKLRLEGDNAHTGYREAGYMTYWVTYEKISEKEYLVRNVYSHRMKIELEEVWNGVRQDHDL